jgi:DNA-binding transcriptional regulator YdaS (Cro superfamily)
METLTPLEAIRKAVKAAGSQAALSRLLGVTQPTVSGWCKGRELTDKHVLTIERELGISRHDLRPDLYPRETAPAAPATSFEHAR